MVLILIVLTSISRGDLDIPKGAGVGTISDIRDPLESIRPNPALRRKAERLYTLWLDRRENPEKLAAYGREVRDTMLEERSRRTELFVEAARVAAEHETPEFMGVFTTMRYNAPHLTPMGAFQTALYLYDAHAEVSPLQRVAIDLFLFVETGEEELADWEMHKYYIYEFGLNSPDLLFRMVRQSPERAMNVFLNDLADGRKRQNRVENLEKAEVQEIALLARAVDDEVWANKFGIIPSGKKEEARAAMRELATYGLPKEGEEGEEDDGEGGPRWWVRLFALHMMARHPDDLATLDLLDQLQHDPYQKLRTEARLLNDTIRGALDNSDTAPERPWEQEGDDAEAGEEGQAVEFINLSE